MRRRSGSPRPSPNVGVEPVKQEFEVSVEELLRTLQRRGIPLPSETGAFITLEVCEQMIDRPIQISAQDIAINEIGEVLCAVQPTPADEVEAVRCLLTLLGDLLVCAAPGVPAMLLELVERGASAPELTLDRLRDELEASLLPLNRGATRRVLARLLREARKAGPSLRAGAQPSAADIDAQFDALLGTASSPGTEHAFEAAPTTPRLDKLEGVGASSAAHSRARSKRFDDTPVTEPQLGGGAAPASTARARELDAAVASTRRRARGASSQRVAVASPQASIGSAALDSDEHEANALAEDLAEEDEQATAARNKVTRARGPDLDELIEAEPSHSRAGGWVFVVCVAAALGLLTAYLSLGREGVRNVLGLSPERTYPAAPKPAVHAAKRQVGELLVNSEPARAQVFLFIGPAPALATDLPLGVAQEFVALAEGYTPARAVVPADAHWEETSGQPRYELAMQATHSNVELAKQSLGKSLLPQDVGTPQARVGSVRVVTTPPGAKVYQLIGFTPDVRVENLPLDQSYEVLVYSEGKPIVSRQLTAADFAEHDGKRLATLDVAFGPKPR